MDAYADVYKVNQRKARRNHTCVSCRGQINTGEYYCYHHGIFDNRAFDMKVCIDCDTLLNDFNAEQKDMEDKATPAELYEYIFESRDIVLIKKYIRTAQKRGALVASWTKDVLNDLEKGNN